MRIRLQPNIRMPVKDDAVAGKIIEELTHGKYIFVAEYTHVKITSCKRQKIEPRIYLLFVLESDDKCKNH